jgi:glutathione synthase/RimK-type ligase-like ATP-grasp enzyme
MKIIYLLTDYLNRFGSKHNSDIYKDGMDKSALIQNFHKYGYKAKILALNEIDFKNNEWRNVIVLYSSQEDIGYYYKSYIEDVIYGLELAGAKIIPSFKYLRANNNKVFMEILRDQTKIKELRNIEARHYGTLEEAINDAENFNYPVVVKGAGGAMSSNVELSQNKHNLKKIIKYLAKTRNLKEEAREYIRSKKYKGYQKQSKYRKKFIIQDYLPGLKNDWKVLVFGDKLYIFERHVRKNDFRASGSGQSAYLYGSSASIPEGIFEISLKIKKTLNLPMVSLDFAQYKNELYLIEFQALYFGTVGQWRSDFYYQFDGGCFVKRENTIKLEDLFAESITEYLKEP